MLIAVVGKARVVSVVAPVGLGHVEHGVLEHERVRLDEEHFARVALRLECDEADSINSPINTPAATATTTTTTTTKYEVCHAELAMVFLSRRRRRRRRRRSGEYPLGPFGSSLMILTSLTMDEPLSW